MSEYDYPMPEVEPRGFDPPLLSDYYDLMPAELYIAAHTPEPDMLRRGLFLGLFIASPIISSIAMEIAKKVVPVVISHGEGISAISVFRGFFAGFHAASSIIMGQPLGPILDPLLRMAKPFIGKTIQSLKDYANGAEGVGNQFGFASTSGLGGEGTQEQPHGFSEIAINAVMESAQHSIWFHLFNGFDTMLDQIMGPPQGGVPPGLGVNTDAPGMAPVKPTPTGPPPPPPPPPPYIAPAGANMRNIHAAAKGAHIQGEYRRQMTEMLIECNKDSGIMNSSSTLVITLPEYKVAVYFLDSLLFQPIDRINTKGQYSMRDVQRIQDVNEARVQQVMSLGLQFSNPLGMAFQLQRVFMGLHVSQNTKAKYHGQIVTFQNMTNYDAADFIARKTQSLRMDINDDGVVTCPILIPDWD